MLLCNLKTRANCKVVRNFKFEGHAGNDKCTLLFCFHDMTQWTNTKRKCFRNIWGYYKITKLKHTSCLEAKLRICVSTAQGVGVTWLMEWQGSAARVSGSYAILAIGTRCKTNSYDIFRRKIRPLDNAWRIFTHIHHQRLRIIFRKEDSC